MTDIPQRPVALTVLPDNIPAELKELAIWSCWRYEWDGKRWTKVPYIPYTTTKAASTRPASWRKFKETIACYLERRDFFDGVFIAVVEPFAAGDFDHTRDTSRVPDTYAEYTPSDNGVRFLGRGTLPGACKKANGELYCKARFVSITGHRIPGFPADIRPIQPALDTLYAELKGDDAANIKDGKAGNGNRAANVAAIPEDEWEAGRQILRSGIHRLLARLRASSVSSKTHKDDTQLGYLLRENYTGFHEKWSYAGIVRDDGSIDSSQIRAVMASNIRRNRFTFPEYAALMSHFYAAECLKKWKDKQRFREELATLWLRARTPRTNQAPPPAPEPVKRGKGSDHAVLLDRAFQVCLDFKAGAQALASTSELAKALGVERETMSRLLGELQDAGRITYRTMKNRQGIVIEFNSQEVVINENKSSGDAPHTEAVNERKSDEPISATSDAAEVVINARELGSRHTAPKASEPTQERAADERENAACLYIEPISNQTVLHPPASITTSDAQTQPPTLAQLAAHYLSTPATAIGERRVNEKTGTFVYRRSAQHFAELVLADYGDHYRHDAAAEAYKAEQARREELARQEWERFYRRLKAMSNDDLLTYVCSRLRADVADLARQGEGFDKHLYKARLEHAKKHVAWRGLEWPKRGTKLKPYTKPEVKPRPVVEQADMLASVNVESMTERLKRLRDARRE
jgi:DNA-binding Lrp family transcriptional regulator